MDSLQEAFIHPLEPCEASFITDAHFISHPLNWIQQTPVYPHGKAWKGHDNFFYNYD